MEGSLRVFSMTAIQYFLVVMTFVAYGVIYGVSFFKAAREKAKLVARQKARRDWVPPADYDEEEAAHRSELRLRRFQSLAKISNAVGTVRYHWDGEILSDAFGAALFIFDGNSIRSLSGNVIYLWKNNCLVSPSGAKLYSYTHSNGRVSLYPNQALYNLSERVMSFYLGGTLFKTSGDVKVPVPVFIVLAEKIY